MTCKSKSDWLIWTLGQSGEIFAKFGHAILTSHFVEFYLIGRFTFFLVFCIAFFFFDGAAFGLEDLQIVKHYIGTLGTHLYGT